MRSPRSLPHRWRIAVAITTLVVAVSAFVAGPFASAHVSRGETADHPTVVLVHGAWADGSSWSSVAARLHNAGYDVRVPPNNLRGVASDAADIASFVNTIPGSVVLVGHSYGGVVITNAATATNNVTALVYVDALIPDEGDTLLGMTHEPSIFAQDPSNFLDFVPDAGAAPDTLDTYVKPTIYREAFAARGIEDEDVAVLAATQRPLSSRVFDEPSHKQRKNTEG